MGGWFGWKLGHGSEGGPTRPGGLCRGEPISSSHRPHPTGSARVVATPWNTKDGDGTWQQYVAINESALHAVPDELDDEAACQFFVNPVTVYGFVATLEAQGLIKNGWIVSQAAGSAVGRLLISYAKSKGLKTINLVRRAELEPELLALGADVVLDTTRDDIGARIREATGVWPSEGSKRGEEKDGGGEEREVSPGRTHARMRVFALGARLPPSSKCAPPRLVPQVARALTRRSSAWAATSPALWRAFATAAPSSCTAPWPTPASRPTSPTCCSGARVWLVPRRTCMCGHALAGGRAHAGASGPSKTGTAALVAEATPAPGMPRSLAEDNAMNGRLCLPLPTDRRDVSIHGFWLGPWFFGKLPAERRPQAIKEIFQGMVDGPLAVPAGGKHFSLDQFQEAIAEESKPGRGGKVFLEG